MADTIVPLTSREKFKFYEPLVLLKALNLEMSESAKHFSPEQPDDCSDPRDLFEATVYKLAHVCDNVKGEEGGTVTSLVILYDKSSNAIEYKVASNQRTQADRSETTDFVRSLLHKIGTFPAQKREDDQAESTRRNILHHILLFNRQRIKLYLIALESETRKCIQSCIDDKTDKTDESAITSKRLKDLLERLQPAISSKPQEVEFLKTCESILHCLNRIENSDTGRHIVKLSREVRESGQETMACWPELRHMTTRLLAYPQGVEFFLRARREWPQLFDTRSISVTFVPSSEPWPRPFRNKSLTADSIVRRMTRKEKQIQIFRDFVKDLQLYNLDDRIVAEFQKDSFRPVVHSEVLLLDHLDRTGGVAGDRFFNGWAYIGSSKPICKLCNYYFEQHKSGVGHRPSHGNLYISWRVPDLLREQGAEGVSRRQIMFDRMLQEIRKDAFDLVRKRTEPTRRGHDSVTSSARFTLEDRWSVASDAADLESVTAKLSLSDDEEGGAEL